MPDIGPLSPFASHDPRRYLPSSSGSGIGGVLREFHIPWPEADESALRDAAAAWHRLAEAVRDSYGFANKTASSLTGNNTGAAIDAFERYWAKFGRPRGALILGADACDAMARACGQYADRVADVKRRIEEAVAGAGATLVVGTIGAVVTFGATEAAADALVAGLVPVVAGWVMEMGLDMAVALAEISDSVGSAVAAGAQITAGALRTEAAASTAGSALAGVAGGTAGTVLTAPLGQLTGQAPLSPSQLGKDIVAAGMTNGFGSMLARLGELSGPQLARLLDNAASSVATSDPETFMALRTLSQQVSSTTGKVSASVLASAASQLIVTQNVTAMGFTQDQLQELLQSAAEAEER